ncbi:MAG: hypothetical protein ACTSRW_05690 [Candidatus Helarchaeota archaeon]
MNCRACIKQCPKNALFLAPETEAAKMALEKLQEQIESSSCKSP